HAQKYLELLTKSEEEGGPGFEGLMDFFQTLVGPGNDAVAAANMTRFLKSNGREIMETIVARAPAVGQEFIDEKFDEKLEKVLQAEGKAIQELLTCSKTTSILELLKEFSMEQLGDQLEGVAPTLWRILAQVAEPNTSTRREKQGPVRREKRLVSCGSKLPDWDIILIFTARSSRAYVLCSASVAPSWRIITKWSSACFCLDLVPPNVRWRFSLTPAFRQHIPPSATTSKFSLWRLYSASESS
ncbi:hypothetical protein C8J57DRAFT_1057382, partial [Mycena rebaudengoi]